MHAFIYDAPITKIMVLPPGQLGESPPLLTVMHMSMLRSMDVSSYMGRKFQAACTGAVTVQ